MPRTPPPPSPPEEEGIFGPGGRRFVTWLLVIAALVGIGLLLLNVDLDELADEIERATEQTTTEEPAEEPQGSGGGDSDDATANQVESAEAAGAQLSAAGLSAAISALRDELGGDPDLLRVRANPDAIELAVREGDQPAGYRWADSELAEQEVVMVVGSEDLAERDFRASSVEPRSLDRLLRGAERRSGGRELEVVNATLEAGLVDGRLAWQLNATAPNGANVSFRARPDGSRVEQLGSSGPPGAGLPPEAQRQIRQAQKRGECIAGAGGDPEKINECLERFAP